MHAAGGSGTIAVEHSITSQVRDDHVTSLACQSRDGLHRRMVQTKSQRIDFQHGESLIAYNAIGIDYDETRRAEPVIVNLFLRHLGSEYDRPILDLACGTGNYTQAIAGGGRKVLGVDISTRMLTEARRKTATIPFVCGDAHCLPFGNSAFAAVTCCLAIHHFGDLPRPFTEVARVIGQGKFLIFTCTGAQTNAMWLRHYWPDMIERAAAKEPKAEAVHAALAAAGFEVTAEIPWFVPSSIVDQFMYAGKYDPTRYLNPKFRRGVSSFAQLIEPKELANGLERLEHDIASGAITDIIASHENLDGDYLFVAAER